MYILNIDPIWIIQQTPCHPMHRNNEYNIENEREKLLFSIDCIKKRKK